MDLIIRNARLHDRQIVDIGIEDGAILSLEPGLDSSGREEIDAQERLALPAFVNGQLHACKSFWGRLLSELPETVRQLPRFEAAAHVKRLYTAEDVFRRVDETMRLAIQNGTCAIRLFADVDVDSELRALDGLLQIRERYSPLMKVQVVAFPQDGFADKKTVTLMHEALSRGADVVGGIPWIEQGTAAQQRHVEACFALARDSDRDLHFVCDDLADPGSRTLEMVARQALAHDYQGRVSATQCAALASYPDDYAEEVIGLVAAAGMTIFANSHVSLIATEFERRQPWPRGITRVRELLDAGVPIACAQDDIDNWFYPFGRNDMLEVAQFMAHTGQFAWHDDIDRVLPMVSTTPADVLGLEGYGLDVGATANLVILDAGDWRQAVQYQAAKRFVILAGRLVAENRFEARLTIENLHKL